MKEIQLTRGKTVLVDDEDFDYLSQFKWVYNGNYATMNVQIGYKKQKVVRMHRMLMNAPDNMQVDHIDNNKLNNQKNNLRVCTSAENRRNTPRHKNNKSGYKGVCLNRHKTGWVSTIVYKGKKYKLGNNFKSPEEAAKAYDIAALKYHGEFANLNFPK